MLFVENCFESVRAYGEGVILTYLNQRSLAPIRRGLRIRTFLYLLVKVSPKNRTSVDICKCYEIAKSRNFWTTPMITLDVPPRVIPHKKILL